MIGEVNPIFEGEVVLFCAQGTLPARLVVQQLLQQALVDRGDVTTYSTTREVRNYRGRGLRVAMVLDNSANAIEVKIVSPDRGHVRILGARLREVHDQCLVDAHDASGA